MARKSDAANQASKKKAKSRHLDPRLQVISVALAQGDIKRARALAAAIGAATPTSI